MILTTDIVNALAKLTEAIDELKQIHTGLLPNGFKRPALLIDPRERKVQDSSRYTVFVNETIRLVTIGDLTERGNVDVMGLLSLQERVQALFDCGKLAVGDRLIEVKAGQSWRDGDVSYLDISLEFYTARREVDPVHSLIESVNIDVLPIIL